MVGMLHRLGPILGGAGGVGLFWLAARGLAGTGLAVAGHLAVVLLALFALALALRRPGLRGMLLTAALVLLALNGASAMLPALILSQAQALAVGRPYCLLAPEVPTDPDAGRDRVYPIALPPGPQDLTLLTLAQPLTLALWLEAPKPDLAYGGKPDAVFETWTYRLPAVRFVETENFHLRGTLLSILADCLPEALPVDATGSAPAALVVYRPLLTGADGRPDWGPRAADLYRLPQVSGPFHTGRFARAELGFAAPVMPDGSALRLTVRYLDAPADWLAQRMAQRVRDADAPLDFARLPVNALGLHALEYPSTSVAEKIDGTYVAFAPDGSARTVIACDPWSCQHEFLPALPQGPARLTLRFSYPPDRLPDWRRIEALAAKALADALTRP